jgi:hypothetical protein
VFPSHTESQIQTFAATNASFNLKCLGLAVKFPARKAYYYAVAAVKTINHPLYKRIRNGFGNIPEANHVFLTKPVTPDGREMFGVYPSFITYSI